MFGFKRLAFHFLYLNLGKNEADSDSDDDGMPFYHFVYLLHLTKIIVSRNAIVDRI